MSCTSMYEGCLCNDESGRPHVIHWCDGPHIDDIGREEWTDEMAEAYALRLKEEIAQLSGFKADADCDCYRCQYARAKTIVEGMTLGMVLCPNCGNKRCPHGTDHTFACTGSNEPGQKGSRYP